MMIHTVINTNELTQGLSASHPATSLPTVFVIPIAEIRKAALVGEIPIAVAAGGKWVYGMYKDNADRQSAAIKRNSTGMAGLEAKSSPSILARHSLSSLSGIFDASVEFNSLLSSSLCFFCA